ncbi:MAG: TldD/PmbA family protein [Acidimicrobiales bacterium]
MSADLLGLADRVAGRALPGEQIEAWTSRSRRTEVLVYGGEVDSVSSAEVEGVGIRVVRDGHQGFASAGMLDDDVVDETLAEARDNASFGTPDEHAGLGEPDGVHPAQMDLWREGLAGFGTEEKVELALELERAVLGADPRVRGVRSASYDDAMVEVAVASNLGIRAAGRRTNCSLSAMAIVGDGEETQTGFGWSLGRSPEDLDLTTAARDAADRALRLLGARQPPSRRVVVVLDPLVTSSFLNVLAGALSGEAVLKGRSMFADRLGEEVAAGLVTLVEDPTIAEAAGACEHDAEGLATRRTVLIEDGALRGFLHNVWTARRTGAASTASAMRGGFRTAPGVGARALALAPGSRSQAELLAEVGDGLLVTGVQGLHSGANPVSGDFSVGATGLLVRGGTVAEPAREVTIASTLPRMLRDVVAVGDDLQWLPSAAAGVTLVISEMTMSGA